MDLADFREGLDILSQYYENPDGYHLGAEHDQIYLYATEKPLALHHIKRMVDLGWWQEYDRDDPNADFMITDYRPDEGWTTFV